MFRNIFALIGVGIFCTTWAYHFGYRVGSQKVKVDVTQVDNKFQVALEECLKLTDGRDQTICTLKRTQEYRAENQKISDL